MAQNDLSNGGGALNRREFLANSTAFGSLMLMMGGVPLLADDAKTNAAPGGDTGFSTVGKPVSLGVIGCGLWAREILQTLALLPNAPVVALCDNYKPFLNRAKEYAPAAQLFADYHELLGQKSVEAVIVATPTHQHREIVEAALKAGKHVYCEVPLAHTIEDAKAIANAAKAAERLYFQPGLQSRSDPQFHFVRSFLRSGAVGSWVSARLQSRKKQSWRRASPNPEREKESNWKLDKTLSLGLTGELGIQQLDKVSWYLDSLPNAVFGTGAVVLWKDGREVADNAQALLKYPEDVNCTAEYSLCNSFDADYEMLYGNFATVMMRERKAWLFKEDDSPLLGWEIYASKMQFYESTGITLAANASKSVQAAKSGKESPYEDSTLHHALKVFVNNAHIVGQEVKNFVSTYGEDADGLKDTVDKALKTAQHTGFHSAGYKEGYQATVIAIKSNEAVVKGQTVEIPAALYEI
jgi:predicted dehydrogenase